MNLLRSCFHELYKLFVDDGANAARIVGWIAVAYLVLRQTNIGAWAGPLLFAGLAVVFVIGLRSKP